MVLTSTVMGYTSRWSPLKLCTRAIPDQLSPTQILIKLSYIGLNPIDIKLKSIAVIPMRYTIGKDFCGTVEAVGSDLVEKYKIGERVCGGLLSPLDGFVGTRALLDATKHAILRPPANLSDEEAAAFPLTFGTAWEMLERVNVGPDSAVLVLGGASNVGAYAIQILKKHYKVSRVVATCSSDSSEYVKKLGADETVDYRSENVSSVLVGIARDKKFQAIVDTVGGYDALRVWPEILNAYSDGAVYITNAGDGAPSGTYAKDMIRSTFNAPWIITRLVLGKRMGINYQVITARDGDWIKAAPEFFSDESVKIPIDSVTEIQHFQAAWDRLNHVRARGKVLIKC